MKKAPIKDVVMTTVAAEEAPTQEPPRWLVLSLQILAYGIPLSFLAYVLYINYLPFGYDKTFTIDVGAEGDTDSSQAFYLEPSPDLSERKVLPDGTTYRELDGIAYAVSKPNAVLKNTKVTFSVEGEGVSIIPPVIDFDPDSVEWDYEWDFTQGKTPEELGLVGNAFPFDGVMYFDGLSRLELPNSADRFEEGPFAVYVEWTPEDAENDFQQILGHFNWEIWQHSDKIGFQVGRMNSNAGPGFTVEAHINSQSDFFYKKHSLLAVYEPGENGLISLYIDGTLQDIKPIGSNKIFTEYGNSNLQSGWSSHNHGENPYLLGSISKVFFSHSLNTINSKEVVLNNLNEQKTFFIKSNNIEPVYSLIMKISE